MRQAKTIYFLLIQFILFTSFALEHGVAFAQTVSLKIIETSDVHGAIYPYNFRNDKESLHSLAQVKTYLNQERENKNQEVILLDNGDILQGTPVVYYYNFEKSSDPHIYAEVMNYMGYDAGTVGNHDIETGHDVYDRFLTELDFPWMAANAVKTENGQPYFQPYYVFERKGIKIAVLGLITPAIPSWLPEKIWEGMEFEDMIESAQKWVKIIMEKENPEILIGLFHAGIDYTYGNQTADTYKNENAAKLVAERVPGFDIVFVGHDHHEWNTSTINTNGETVFILGTSSSARNVAVANVKLDYNSIENLWEKEVKGELIQMNDVEPDKDFLEKFNYGFDEVREYVSKPIGIFTSSISTRESLFGNSAFVDLIHTIQLDLTKADISFTAPLSFNSEIKQGTVYVRDMFNLYRYENLLYTMELTGEEIKNYLEYSYGDWFNQMKNEFDHLLNFETDEAGEIKYSERTRSPQLKTRHYNFDSAAGIEYTVDVSKPAGERVTISSMTNGEPFIPGKTYKVAVNSYRGNGGGRHLTLGAKIPEEELPGRVINSTEKDLRYFLMKWIEKKEIVSPTAFGNWRVIPGAWWEQGKRKDYTLLFERDQ